MSSTRTLGPFGPLETLERHFTEESVRLFLENKPTTMPNMTNDANNPQPNRVGIEPSTSQDDGIVVPRRGSARWPAKWRLGATATSVTRRPAEIGGKVPSLPQLPKFPSLPSFEDGYYGEETSTGLACLTRIQDKKPLPDIPLKENDTSAGGTLNTLHDVSQDLAPAAMGNTNYPLQPYGLLRRYDPRHLQQSNTKGRSNSAAVQKRGALVPTQETCSLSTSNVPRVAATPPTRHTRKPQHLILRKPLPSEFILPLTPPSVVPSHRPYQNQISESH